MLTVNSRFGLILVFSIILLNSPNLFGQKEWPQTNGPARAVINTITGNAEGNNLHVVDRPFWAPNRIGTYITNEGNLVSWQATGSAGMEWPAGSGKRINFATGFWIAGIKNGEIVTAAAEFLSEFQPGPVLNYTPGTPGTPANPASPFFKVYIFENPDGNLHATNYSDWPAAGKLALQQRRLQSIPATSAAWAVFNDFSQELHDNFMFGPPAIRLQIPVGWITLMGIKD